MSAQSDSRVILSSPLAFGGFQSARALSALLPTKGNVWFECSKPMSFELRTELLSSECCLFSHWKSHPHPKPFLSSGNFLSHPQLHILVTCLMISATDHQIVLNLGKPDLGECLLKKTLLGTCCRSTAGQMCMGGGGCVRGSSRTAQLQLRKLQLIERWTRKTK